MGVRISDSGSRVGVPYEGFFDAKAALKHIRREGLLTACCHSHVQSSSAGRRSDDGTRPNYGVVRE